MHIRLGAMIVGACVALTGCAEYSKPKRTVVHRTAPVADYKAVAIAAPPVADAKKPTPIITQSITPVAVATPAPALEPTLDPIPPLDAIPIVETSVEDQLKAAWMHICGLRNVEHIEKGRVNETEAQKHAIDEKCADVRRDSHVQ